MPQPISKKHHYLPELYLNGFTGSDGKFAVFDLKEKRLLKRRLSPSQIFYELHRNTFEVNGVKDDFVEKMYQRLETQFGHVFKKIREQESHSILDVPDMFNIVLFIGSLYWRIPTTDTLFKEVLMRSTPDELNFKIVNTKTGEEVDRIFYDILKGRDGFAGAYKMIKPIIDYIKNFDPKRLNDWKVYFATLNNNGERKELHLVGDNPVIFRQPGNDNIFDQELIVPLSSAKTLYHTRGKDISIIDPSSRINVDRLIFLQSERYVCGPDSYYLESIADQAYKFIETSPDMAVDFLRHQVFNIFH
ncbi:DUF4238 domain-containing protein [Spirosoma sp. RP8]|uniref:DUF4238 domain-containing protein n=1 Tax=Spirosoma liriopis TaxID=2937440 RepID=A0ABT0HR02_9BACT|nr:DUF4238 domain-containing protein [Spirosoma liriopis]MCK8494610.1 DUF4238 domain-containing protein [Spirosoma liriopis]